jgi:hypothetical protein
VEIPNTFGTVIDSKKHILISFARWKILHDQDICRHTSTRDQTNHTIPNSRERNHVHLGLAQTPQGHRKCFRFLRLKYFRSSTIPSIRLLRTDSLITRCDLSARRLCQRSNTSVKCMTGWCQMWREWGRFADMEIHPFCT